VDDTLRAAGGPGGLAIELVVAPTVDGACLRAVVRNEGPAPVAVERLVALSTAQLEVGADPRRWRTYRNGFQSWAGTATIGVDETDPDLPFALARAGVTDARHPSPRGPGHVRSDSVGAVAEPASGDALGLAATTLADAFAFVELDAPGGRVRSLEVWADLDGIELAPGEAAPPLEVALVVVEDRRDAGWAALRAGIEAAGEAMDARGADRPPPAGWCSWYYYFTDVAEPDVRADLEVLAADGRDGPAFGCEYVMVDDGHQSAIGDWLATDPASFPSGMAAVAGEIAAAGFDAGLWWAPFLAGPRSQVAREHPEWLLRDRRGRRVVGLFNPAWEKARPIWVLDATRDDVAEYLAEVARTIAGWGYGIQKLDFLYAGALEGVRADARATRAQALRRGLEAVRAGAGDDAFLLGCGCPLGPAVGVVDAMRIGADVTPYWSNAFDRVVGRGRHALATRNAVRNTLTRAVFDRAWWRNDPDCLLARDTETRLTLAEVRTMATAYAMTDGMFVLSDRLAAVSEERRALAARARDLAGGIAEVVDLFERDLPEVVVARHRDRVDVAAFNLGEAPRRVAIDLARCGLAAPDADLPEFWTGRTVSLRGGIVAMGDLPAHGVAVVSLPSEGA
ncbi:MAG: alpha-galactosidase, partial [Acidimicrobiales bacterium]|nr:alpha-galactosidase [Acidimicrobiales bacterium]